MWHCLFELYWQAIIAYRLLRIVCWLLIIEYWLFVAACWLWIISYCLLTQVFDKLPQVFLWRQRASVAISSKVACVGVRHACIVAYDEGLRQRAQGQRAAAFVSFNKWLLKSCHGTTSGCARKSSLRSERPMAAEKWKPKYNVWDCIRHWRKWKRLPSGPVHAALALHHNQRCRHVERQHRPLCLKSQLKHAAVKEILVATCQILVSTSNIKWSIINNQQQITDTQ